MVVKEFFFVKLVGSLGIVSFRLFFFGICFVVLCSEYGGIFCCFSLVWFMFVFENFVVKIVWLFVGRWDNSWVIFSFKEFKIV